MSANEVDITFQFADGHTEKNLPNWSCELINVPLVEGNIPFTVSYEGLSAQFTVNVIQRPVPETQAPTQPALSEADQLRLEVCNYAKQFLGGPYRLGGTDLLHGTDCSGFVMRVFEHFGIKTTRTSRSQAQAGTPIPIDLNTLRPGDLLFYLDAKTNDIGHVAIYIGNGQIIHATNPKLGIIISDVFYNTPVKAVTFLP